MSLKIQNMARKRRGKKKGSTQPSNNNNSNTVAWVIPKVNLAQKIVSAVGRWETNAGFGTQSTPQTLNMNNLIFSFGCMAVSATVAWSIFFAIRIKKIVLYGPAVVSTSSSAISFEWSAPSGAIFAVEPATWSGGSVGTAASEKLVITPPKASLWENWVNINSPGGVSFCLCAFPAGTTIDIEADLYVENNDSSTSKSSFTGLSTGANYMTGLDGNPLASTVFIVVGKRQA